MNGCGAHASSEPPAFGEECLRPGGLELTLRALEHCSLLVGSRILDVGAGLGATVAALRDLAFDAVGAEPSGAQRRRGLAAHPTAPLTDALGVRGVQPGQRGAVTIATTESLCPHCLRRVPARLVDRDDRVELVKHCADHGETHVTVWRGEPDFWAWRRSHESRTSPAGEAQSAVDCPAACGLCDDHHRSTCCVLLEVTERCDLGCPVCYASSEPAHGVDPPMAQIARRFEALAEMAPRANVQLSGGEPTLRDDLPQIVALGRSFGFPFFQVNSNGLRLAAEPAYAQRLADAGLSTVFLQFDGVTDEPNKRLRGAPLLARKLKAIGHCAAAGLGVVLVPTLVPGVNAGPVVDIDETLAVLERTGASVVVGIPTQVLALAHRSAARGRPVRSVRSVLLSADHVPGAVVRAVEALWRCRVFAHYGSTEMGLGGGVECAAGGGYHLREADLLFEVVSPQTGLPVAVGEVGEVVFTTLTRAGMPLVRYRTGDMSRFLPDPCACGARLRRLAPVGTRPTAAVTLRGGGRLQFADLDDAVLGREDVIDSAPRIGIAGGRDELHVVAWPAVDGAAVDTAALERELLEVPAIASAVRGGALVVRATAVAPSYAWPCSTGMLKRTFNDPRFTEEAHA
jgi:pyruvate-formate lyase-activating enzyme